MKQNFAFWTFAGRGVGDVELLRRAREIGYHGVELIDQSFFDPALDLGYELAVQAGHESIESGLNNPANHDRIEREIEANLAICRKYRIGKLVVFSGSRRPGLTESEGIDHTTAGLLRVERAARDAGVTLVLELLNSKIDHPDYQCDTSAWGFAAVAAVGSPNVKLLYDIYHAQLMEGDLISTISSKAAWIGHYHTAGNPGRNDLDSGDQEIAYPAVFRAIAKSGYDSGIGHEFVPVGDPVKALEAAYNLTESSVSGICHTTNSD